MSDQDQLKKMAALEAVALIKRPMIIGVGTGSTVNYFIDGLATIKQYIDAAVASSVATEKRLKAQGIEVVELNSLSTLDLYVDGADEFNSHGYLIKGGGGALTREKVIATMAAEFICIVDRSKQVDVLGKFPVAVEVLPMARSFVAREIVKLHADPVYRVGFLTDNGNVILDIHNLNLLDPVAMEVAINNIPGVVANGIFAKRKADKLLIASDQGVRLLSR